MCRIAIVLLLASGLLAIAEDKAPSKEAVAALEKLTGAWKVEVEVLEGKERKPDNIQLVFAGDKVTLHEDKKESEAKIKVDPTKKPAHIDIELKEEKMTVFGIYQLDGDALKIAFTKDGGDRPAKFESPEGSKIMVATLKRVKK